MNQKHSTVMREVAFREENLNIPATFGHGTQALPLVYFLSQDFKYYTSFSSENQGSEANKKLF